MHTLLTLFAEGEPPAGGAPGLVSSLLPIILIVGVMYLLMFRPMRKQEAQRQQMIAALKKRDKVVTSGGMIGTVADINEGDNEIVLKVDENSNVRVRVLRSSITQVIRPAEEPAKDAK
jgi:preprotein translocase subunit YajC